MAVAAVAVEHALEEHVLGEQQLVAEPGAHMPGDSRGGFSSSHGDCPSPG